MKDSAFASRVGKINEILKQEGIDCFLVTPSSDMKYLFKVLIPICSPTIVTILILKVIECWNSFVWPRLITDDENYFLVSNGIQTIRESGFGR